jgi:tRNA A37 threonylcarbamoyladenosine dehydratase
VGTSKVHTIRKRLEQIAPWVHFDCRNEKFDASTAEAQLSPLNDQAPDYVVDAIDNIDTKVALLHYCHSNSIPVISSMGAGCKSDPTRVSVGDISASTDDPLSRTTRRRLRLMGVKDGIPVVYSTERFDPSKAQLLPLPEEEYAKGDVKELSVLKDFRVRILPVLGTMPAVFGLCIANHVMVEISGYPHEYVPSITRDKVYDSILGNLQGQEQRLARAMGKESEGLRLPITLNDVGYVVEEVFRGRSVLSGLANRLVLTRWRQPYKNFVEEKYEGQRNSLIQLRDLVLMTKEELVRHEKEILQGDKTPEDLYDEKVLRLVESRMRDEEQYSQFRV